MKHVVFWVGWWLALFWLWLLLAGEWNRQEWIAAAGAATIAATVAELARSRAGFRAAVPLRVLADLPAAALMVVVDFGIVVWALVASLFRRRVVRGELVERKVGSPERATDAGLRAWTELIATYSPNAYVIDIQPQTQRIVLHDLIPYRRSEEPA